MSKISIRYKGFKIVARPYRLRDSGQWTVDFEIRRNGRARPFAVDERFATEQEAGAQCADLGRRIIDGEVPGFSVEPLRGEASHWSARVRLPARWARGSRRSGGSTRETA